MRSTVVLAAVALLAGCRSAPERLGSRGAPPASGAALLAAEIDTRGPTLPPLAAEWMERIDLEGGGVVFVAPPVGATEPRPVVVAIHGAVDDPGLICSAWRLVTDAYPFVVCPGGKPVGKGTYVWPSSEVLDKSIDRALVAVRAKYAARLRSDPAVYAAFSQGANMAGPVLAKSKGRFARAVLSEGGYRALDNPGSARGFVAAGGERVLLTCSQPGCAGAFERSRAPLMAAGANVRVSYSGPHGHSMPPPVRESINAALPWVVDGLGGWEGYAAAPRLSAH
ncbi:MAG TPA: hypothetical protein VM925_37825 [Labilithrix sp.]|nr:hypothetical protein [Labilithrix sp.]